MSDSNTPVIPTRPTCTKHDSQSPSTIPPIPVRPRNQVNCTDNRAKKEDIADGNMKAATKFEKHSDCLKHEQNLELGPDFSVNDGINRADVPSDIVSDVNEASSTESSYVVENEGDRIVTSNRDAEPVTEIQIDEHTVDETTIDLCRQVLESVGTIESLNSIELAANDYDSSTHKDENSVKRDSNYHEAQIEDPNKAKVCTERSPQIPDRPQRAAIKRSTVLKNTSGSEKVEITIYSTYESNETFKTTYGDEGSDCDGGKEGILHEPLLKTISKESSLNTKDSCHALEPISMPVNKHASQSNSPTSLIKEPLMAMKIDTESHSQQDSGSQSESQHVVQPVIPKRPSVPTTPRIPCRPVKNGFLKITEKSPEDKINDSNIETDSSPGKVPPSKSKKLSSKIAAFQKMFDQAPLEHTQPKLMPFEREKFSSNRADFASNLQTMMGRGLPLPGMSIPEMLKKRVSQPDDTLSEGSSETINSPIPRRTRGPRGKKLPKSIQEAKIEFDPRFTVSVFDLWDLNLSRKSLPKHTSSTNKKVESQQKDLSKESHEVGEPNDKTHNNTTKTPEVYGNTAFEVVQDSESEDNYIADLSFGTRTPSSIEEIDENVFQDAQGQNSKLNESELENFASVEPETKHNFVEENDTESEAEEDHKTFVSVEPETEHDPAGRNDTKSEVEKDQQSPDLVELTNYDVKFVTASSTAKCSRVPSKLAPIEDDIDECPDFSESSEIFLV